MLLRPFLSQSPAVLTDWAGCTYDLPSYAEPISQHIFTFGAYEAGTQKVILDFLPERGTFIDVGANVGALAIPIAKARPNASILCIEADSNIYDFLQKNICRNDCRKVRAISCVAGPADGDIVPFYRAPNEKFGMGSISPQFDAEPTMLQQRSVDSLMIESSIHHVDVVKIDVEGAELGVLRGAQRLLAAERPPVIVFEFVDWAESRIPGQKSGDAQAALVASGYRLFRLEPHGMIGAELVSLARDGAIMLLALPPGVST
jgi:FkbM family methyltransferase